MKDIWKYLKQNKKETILAPIFKMLEACFELFIPLVVADIIDIGIASGDTGYIIRRGLFMILLGAIGFGLAVIAQYFSAKSAVEAGSAIRKELFYHISDLNYERLDHIGVSSLITCMTSDINQVQNGINYSLRLFLRSPFIVIGAAIMSCAINLKASLVFWGTIAVLTLIIFLIIKLTSPMNADVQLKLEKVMRSFRENLQGVRVVRAFNRQASEKEQFNKRHEKLYTSQIAVGRVASLLNPLTFAVINLAIILILYTGAIDVSVGDMKQGEVIALYNYMSQILVELIKLANVVLMLSKAAACFKRIQDALHIKPNLKNGTYRFDNSDAVDIKLENLTFSYGKGMSPAISKISCHIPAGTKVGIIGATASGKTTLINLIAGYYERTGGEILLNDIPIEEYERGSLSRNVSIVPQKSVLFKGSVRSNLKWGDNSANDEECFEALEASGAADFIKDKGMGLDLLVSQNGRNFSGGQRQRLAIARAIVKKAGILILDDSYSALDYATEAHVKACVSTKKKNCTVFTISQRVSSIYGSDLILVMDRGHLVGAGSHEELFENCDIYNEICRSQHFGEEEAVQL